MNAGLTITAILSLILALESGNVDVAKKGPPKEELVTNKDTASGGIWGVVSGTTNSPSGHNLNHNETLVRDAAPNKFSVELGGRLSRNETLLTDAR